MAFLRETCVVQAVYLATLVHGEIHEDAFTQFFIHIRDPPRCVRSGRYAPNSNVNGQAIFYLFEGITPAPQVLYCLINPYGRVFSSTEIHSHICRNTTIYGTSRWLSVSMCSQSKKIVGWSRTPKRQSRLYAAVHRSAASTVLCKTWAFHCALAAM